MGGYPLENKFKEALNDSLDGSDLGGFRVYPEIPAVLVLFDVPSIFPEGGSLEEAYPLKAVCYPVSRIAASYSIEERVVALDLNEMENVISEFNFKSIDDWDIIDPPSDSAFRWNDRISVDIKFSESGEHLMEVWQDDLSYKGINVAIWFDEIYIFDRECQIVTPEKLSAWRSRKRDAMKGESWRHSRSSMSISTEDFKLVDIARRASEV